MLIELSGIDGSGKSSQSDHLFRYLNELGIPCYQRRLRSTFKRILDSVVLDVGGSHWWETFPPSHVELAHALEMQAMVATQIEPINDGHQVLLMDGYLIRWIMTALEFEVDNIEPLLAIYERVPKPDLSFVFSVAPSVAFERILNRERGDFALRHGREGKLQRSARALGDAIQRIRYRTILLDTSVEKDVTFSQIVRHLHEWARASEGSSPIVSKLLAARKGEA